MSKKHPLSMVQISVISRLKLLALYFKYKRKQSHSSTIVKGLHLPRICLPAEIRLLYALLSQQIQCVKVFFVYLSSLPGEADRDGLQEQ